MTRRLRLAAAVALVAGTAALLAWAGVGPDYQPLPDEVRRLHEALTARQRGEFGRAMRLQYAVWRDDPGNLKMLVALSPRTGAQLLGEELRDSIARHARLSGDPLLERCVSVLMTDAIATNELQALRTSTTPSARRCVSVFQFLVSDGDSIDQDLVSSPAPLSALYIHLGSLVRSDARHGLKRSRQMADEPNHPMLRIIGYAAAIDPLHGMGADDDAIRWERQARRYARDWGPGAEVQLYLSLVGHLFPDDYRDPNDPRAVHARDMQALAERELVRLQDVVDAEGRARIAFALGMRYQANGRQPEALVQFRELARLADSARDPISAATAHGRVGRTLVKLGRLDEAGSHLRRAQAIGGPANAVLALSESSHDLLHLYEALGRFQDAELAGRDFIRHAARAGTRATQMMGHHDLGWLYRRHGRLREAEREFARMIVQVDSLQAQAYWAGEYYESVGQLERAREYYLRGLRNPQDHSRALTALARVDENTGQWASALRFAQLADHDTATWDPEYAPILPGVLARAGRVTEAREQMRMARHFTRESGRTVAFAKTALESAELELSVGNATDARWLADSAATYAARLGAAELEVRALATRALARARQGEVDSAVRHVRAAVRRGDAMGLVQLSAHLHTLRAEVHRAAGDRSAALEAYRVAADLMDSVAAQFRNDPLRAVFRSLHGRVSNGALDLLVGDPNHPRRHDLYAEWSARRKDGGELRGGLAAIRRRLHPTEAVVDYHVGDSVVTALVLTRQRSGMVSLAVSADSLRALVRRFNAPIAPRVGSAIDLAHLGFDTTVASRLYSALIEALRSHVDGRDRLTIVPDGVLHLLPFDALVARREPLRFLMDDITIRYATSLGLPRGADARHSRGPVLVVAGPAGGASEGVEREIAALRATLGARLQVFRAGASPGTLREAAAGASVVHFATHAEANDIDPDHARLALSERDGAEWLHASEVRTWSLRDALVVLSACETGAGRVAGGEGTLSLSRAFLRAGASGTIATLWPVGSSTADLMAAFHGELARGVSPDVALRAARHALRTIHPEPYYWAPFVYVTRTQ